MNAADKGTMHRERDMRSECMGGKGKERESGNQNKSLENRQLSILEKAGKFVRVIDDSKRALVIRVLLCYIECTIHNPQEPHNYMGPTIYVTLVGCVWYINCNIEAP